MHSHGANVSSSLHRKIFKNKNKRPSPKKTAHLVLEAHGRDAA
jgi:hypothetical protein